MKVKSALLALTIGASIAAFGLANAASAKGVTAPALSQAIERAVTGAQADARSQGLSAGRTQVLIDSAVSRVIASSGADAQTVVTALDLSKANLTARGQASPVVVSVLDQAAGDVGATAKISVKGGGGSTLKGTTGAGGSDYRGD